MPAGYTVKVDGLKDFNRDVRKAEKDTRKVVRNRLREVGEVVRVDAANRLQEYDDRSARGLKVRVRAAGIFVEQSLRKTSGLRPDFGELQMVQALLPSVQENEAEMVRQMEKAADDLADVVEGGFSL